MDKNKALRMHNELLTAIENTYELLLAKMESEERNEGNIYRLAVCVGNTAEGLPIQIILELNLNESTFQPLHSIYTFKEAPYESRHPYELEEQPLEDLMSLNLD